MPYPGPVGNNPPDSYHTLSPWDPWAYNGPIAPAENMARWRSRQYVGEAKPWARVRIRRGYMKHKMHDHWPGPAAPASVVGRRPRRFGRIAGLPLFPMFYPDWTPETDWVELPGVHEIDIQQSINYAGGDGGDGSGGAGGSNGIAVNTLTVDNAAWVEVAGELGAYHEKQRGWLWPWRGYQSPFRPGGDTANKNQWYNETPNAQIIIEQGYGSDAPVYTFTGLIDSIGPGAIRPDRISLTSRDFGGVLVDRNPWAQNRDKRIRDPMYFIPPDYRKLPEIVNNKSTNYVIAEDATDIVRCALRWSGFKEWNIDVAGVGLKTAYKVDRSKYWMDVINEVASQIGYVFYIAEPTDDNLSIGVPVFRRQSVLYKHSPIQPVTVNSTMLTDNKPKHDNSNDRYVIRVRGRFPQKGQSGGRPIIGGDMTLDGQVLFTSTYWPPWANKMSGVVKQLTYYNIGQNGVLGFGSDWECQVAAVLIAMQIALSRDTTVVQLPGNPEIGLDCFAFVDDGDPTGVASRLYITNRHSVMSLGGDGASTTPPNNSPGSINEQLFWGMELSGSLCDNSDWEAIREDYAEALDRTLPTYNWPGRAHA